MVKKKKIANDIQDFMNKKLEEVANEAEEIGKLTLDDFAPKCKKCYGIMRVLRPSIEMNTPKGILELHECASCEEREYL